MANPNRARADAPLLRDTLAGLSVAGLLVPEAVAYAGIAGLPPGRALSAAFSGGLAYAAIEALAEFREDLARHHRRLILARTHDRVRAVLTAADLGDLARDATFSVADAVEWAH